MASHRLLASMLLWPLMAAGQNLCTIGTSCGSLSFSFSVPPGPDVNTSAAVYDQNGILVRTLWGNTYYPPGYYTADWDGTLDSYPFITNQTANFTKGSATVTLTAANANVVVGQIPVNASYITAGSVVTSVTGSPVTSFTMNTTALNTGTNQNVDFLSGTRARGTLGQNYTIKLMMNNVVYNYDGHLFTTDKYWYPDTKWSRNCTWYQGMPKMAFAGNRGFVACGYPEGAYGFMMFDKNNPNVPTRPYWHYVGGFTGEFDDVASDGQWVYLMNRWTTNTSYVTAISANSPTPVMMPQGNLDTNGASNIVWTNTASSYVDPIPGTTATPSTNIPSSIAVQRNSATCIYPACGYLLAVAHGSAATPYIAFFDKRTGASLGTVNMSPAVYMPSMAFTSEGLWIAGNDGNLYLMTLTSSLRRQRNRGDRERENGSLRDARTISGTISQPITGFSHVAAVGANTLTNVLYVADGGTNQQIKGYAANTHALVRTYGTLGGYNDCNPKVTNDRLMLDPYATIGVYMNSSYGRYAWVTADDDDNLWIGDQEGARVLHIDANNNYVERILYRRPSYNLAASRTMPTRMFASSLMEYSIDYTKTLGPGDPDPALGGNGAWMLVNNWQVCALGGHGSPSQNNADTYSFTVVERLSNGKVYALESRHSSGTSTPVVIFQLPEDGTPMRYTGVYLDSSGQHFTLAATMNKNGDLRYTQVQGTGANKTINVYNYPLTGFDTNSNPIYGGITSIASTTTNASNAELGSTINGGESSAGGYYAMFLVSTLNIFRHPHVAAFKPGSASYLWQNMPESYQIGAPDFRGRFPQNGPTGLQGGNQGAAPVRAEQNTFIFMYGGNYLTAGAQFFHYYEDGMLIGQFGNVQAFPTFGAPTSPGNFGNAPYMTTTTYNGDIYLYVGDEAYAPAHRWHISNLASIHEYTGTSVLQPNGSVTLARVF